MPVSRAKRTKTKSIKNPKPKTRIEKLKKRLETKKEKILKLFVQRLKDLGIEVVKD